jgi:hypothetical protein
MIQWLNDAPKVRLMERTSDDFDASRDLGAGEWLPFHYGCVGCMDGVLFCVNALHYLLGLIRVPHIPAGLPLRCALGTGS